MIESQISTFQKVLILKKHMHNLASIEESCEGQRLFEDTIIARTIAHRTIALNLRTLREPGRHMGLPLRLRNPSRTPICGLCSIKTNP